MGFIQAVKDKPQIPLTIAGIVALGSAMPHLAHFVDVWRAPETAEAAQKKAEYVDEKFDTYLEEQSKYQAKLDGYNEALTQIQQQQQQQVQQYAPPMPQAPVQSQPHFREPDESGFWCCNIPNREQCWGENGWYRCQ